MQYVGVWISLVILSIVVVAFVVPAKLIGKLSYIFNKIFNWTLLSTIVLIIISAIVLAYQVYMPTNISLTRYQQSLLVNGVSLKPEDSSYEAYSDKKYLSLLNEVIESGYNDTIRFRAINNMILVYTFGIRGESASVTNAYLYCKKEKSLPRNAKLNFDCEMFSPYKQESH